MFIIHDLLHHLNHYHHNPLFLSFLHFNHHQIYLLGLPYFQVPFNILKYPNHKFHLHALLSFIILSSSFRSSVHGTNLGTLCFHNKHGWMLHVDPRIPMIPMAPGVFPDPSPYPSWDDFSQGLRRQVLEPNCFLVGGWPTPLKNDEVSNSWDDDIPNWMESHKIPWIPTTKQFWQFTINTKRQHSLISSQRSTQSQYPHSQCISKILSSWPSDRILTEIEVTKVKWPVQWTNKTYVDHQRTIFKHIVYQCLSTKIILKSSPTSSNMELFRPNDAASGHRWDSCASQPARCRSPSWPSWMSRPFFCKASRWAPRVMSKPVIYI